MRASVLVPTRDRPELLRRILKSVRRTSDARVWAYIDDDQVDLYKDFLSGSVPSLECVVGPRVGPCASANALVKESDGDILGYVPDDAVFASPGWDEALGGVIGQFTNQIGVASPAHNHGNHIDVPFVSRKWTDALGWLCYPRFYHWCWPTVISMIGTAVGAVVRMSPHECYIHHELEPPHNADRHEKDVSELYTFCTYERFEKTVHVMREAMCQSTQECSTK